ncbi:hypothetical protein JCM8097_004930 [Rhodosporidiobolus ruineniae]
MKRDRRPRRAGPPRTAAAALLLLSVLLPLVSADDPTSSADPSSFVAAIAQGVSAVAAAVSSSSSAAAAEAALLTLNPTSTVSTPTPTTTRAETAMWATKTSGGMAQGEEDGAVVILERDEDMVFSCPDENDKWETTLLTTSLQARMTTGAGCTISYTFVGDSVQICEFFLFLLLLFPRLLPSLPATGAAAGVFGCSVNATSSYNETGWFDASALTNDFRPYFGLCNISNLGFGTHTVYLINSPSNPKNLYFTGIRYTVFSGLINWVLDTWDSDLPVAAAENTAVSYSSNATASSGSASSSMASAHTSTSSGLATLIDVNNSNFWWFLIAVAALILISALLVGCLCCRKRPAAKTHSFSSLTELSRRNNSSF